MGACPSAPCCPRAGLAGAEVRGGLQGAGPGVGASLGWGCPSGGALPRGEHPAPDRILPAAQTPEAIAGAEGHSFNLIDLWAVFALPLLCAMMLSGTGDALQGKVFMELCSRGT